MAAIKGSTPIRKILKWTAGIVFIPLTIVAITFLSIYCARKYPKKVVAEENSKLGDQTTSSEFTGKNEDETEGIYDVDPPSNDNGKDVEEPEPNFGEFKDPHDVLDDGEEEVEEDIVSTQRKFTRPYQTKGYLNSGKPNTRSMQSDYNSFCR